MQDIRVYYKKGDIAQDWLARREGEVAWQRVGTLLEMEEPTSSLVSEDPFVPPAPPSARPQPPSRAATMAMFQAQPVASPSSVIARLEAMVGPVKVVGTLMGVGLGALMGNRFGEGGRMAFLIAGTILGGGLGFFFGYLAALFINWAIQMLALQEKIAGQDRDA